MNFRFYLLGQLGAQCIIERAFGLTTNKYLTLYSINKFFQHIINKLFRKKFRQKSFAHAFLKAFYIVLTNVCKLS